MALNFDWLDVRSVGRSPTQIPHIRELLLRILPCYILHIPPTTNGDIFKRICIVYTVYCYENYKVREKEGEMNQKKRRETKKNM